MRCIEAPRHASVCDSSELSLLTAHSPVRYQTESSLLTCWVSCSRQPEGQQAPVSTAGAVLLQSMLLKRCAMCMRSQDHQGTVTASMRSQDHQGISHCQHEIPGSFRDQSLPACDPRIIKGSVTASMTSQDHQGISHCLQAPEWYREGLVGQAIQESGMARQGLFITTKVHPRHHGFNSTIRQTLASCVNLGTDYLDLVLLHYPR